jgi:hypothetical protein
MKVRIDAVVGQAVENVFIGQIDYIIMSHV